MDSTQVPAQFPLTFGENATGSYIRPIPTTSVDPTAASLNLGFPPATGTPVGSGGTPPDIRDENGILNQLSAWAQWQGMGGPIYWDSAQSAAVGGYPKGSVLSAVGQLGAYWISTVDNNVTNPDAAGAGWTRFNLIGLGTAAYKNASSNAQSIVSSVKGATIVGHVAVFTDALGTIEDGGPVFTGGTAAQKAASDNAQPTLSSVVGGTTVNHFAAFADGNGSVKDTGFSPASFDPVGAAAAAQAAAQAFATAAANTAQSNAQTFATNADTVVLGTAQSYAAAQASIAQNNAEAYTDAQVTIERNRAIGVENTKAPLNSPGLTGVPTTPTPPANSADTTIPNTGWVDARIGPPARYARFQIFISGSFAIGSFNWNTPFPSTCLAAVAGCETNQVFNPGAAGNNLTAICYGFNQNGGTVRIDTEKGGSPVGSVWVDVIGFGA